MMKPQKEADSFRTGLMSLVIPSTEYPIKRPQ